MFCQNIKTMYEDKIFYWCISKFKHNNHFFKYAEIYRTPQLKNFEFLKKLSIAIDVLKKKVKFAGRLNNLLFCITLSYLNSVLKIYVLILLMNCQDNSPETDD